jgi:hypothetical protein
MSAEEEQYDDSTMGAPGAPTPVSALEVRMRQDRQFVRKHADWNTGRQWLDSTRYQTRR